jgi:hypothetical protein
LLLLFSPLSFFFTFFFILAIYYCDGQVMVHTRGTTIPPEPYGRATSQPKFPMDISDDEQDELCRMVYMPLVRPTLAHNIKRLEAEFTHGYWPGTLVFYVSITNEHGDERFVKDVDTSNWGPHWTSVNDEFEAKLASNPHLRFLCGHMFFICDGNHCFKAWTGYIDRL